jgi:hypothetical protein
MTESTPRRIDMELDIVLDEELDVLYKGTRNKVVLWLGNAAAKDDAKYVLGGETQVMYAVDEYLAFGS